MIYVRHSMGGLVTLYYLEVLGGRDTCRALISIGTSYSGSIKAIKALTGGLIPLMPRLDDRLVEVARTLPAVHQLLPTYHCVQTDTEPATLTAANLPDLPTSTARNAHALHVEIAHALTRNGPPTYERYAFGGRRQPTDQSVNTSSSYASYEVSIRYTDPRTGSNHYQRPADHGWPSFPART